MDAPGGDRAQSMQIGAILLFGFLIVSISVMQATVIPDQNRQVEFAAYQEAAADLTDVRNDVLAAASRDATLGTTVNTGVDYPNRLLFVNPGPPPNRLATTDERTIAIENVQAVDGETVNTRAYIAGTVSGRSYATRDVRFEPNYNVFDGQPMVVTGNQAYRAAGSRPLSLSNADGTLVSGGEGERIHLTTIDGDLEDGGSAVAVTTESVSTSTQSIGIESADGDPITIELVAPAGVSADGWVDRSGTTLVERYDRVLDAENVTAPDDSAERVELTLEGGDATYQLRISRVEVRSAESGAAAASPDPAYITTRAGDDQSVTTGQRAPITARVNDRFTNAVSNARVEFEVTQSGATLQDAEGTDLGTATTVTTTADGTASVRVDTAGVTQDVEVTATALDATSSVNTTTFDVQVSDDTGGSPDPGAGPSSSIRAGAPNSAGNPLEVPLENPTSETATIEAMGFGFYFQEQSPGGGPGGDRDMSPVELTLPDGGTQTFDIPGSLDALNSPIDVPPSGATLELEFNEPPEEGDFFVVSVQFEDGVTRTFFVGV